MFQAINSKRALKTPSGICETSGAASHTINNNPSACTIPATGLVAPFFTLVTVRANAPVAGMPPTKGITMLAKPCAINSWFGSWRSSIIWSLARAHISEEIAPNTASVTLGSSTAWNCASDITGQFIAGKPDGMPPKRLPMVATGQSVRYVNTVANTITSMGPGTIDSHCETEGCSQRGISSCQNANTSKQLSVSIKVGKSV